MTTDAASDRNQAIGMARKAKAYRVAQQVYRAIAKSLVEFGYSDVTPEMISETTTSYYAGKRGHELPHGIVGMFAENQIEEAIEMGLLPKVKP